MIHEPDGMPVGLFLIYLPLTWLLSKGRRRHRRHRGRRDRLDRVGPASTAMKQPRTCAEFMPMIHCQKLPAEVLNDARRFEKMTDPLLARTVEEEASR